MAEEAKRAKSKGRAGARDVGCGGFGLLAGIALLIGTCAYADEYQADGAQRRDLERQRFELERKEHGK